MYMMKFFMGYDVSNGVKCGMGGMIKKKVCSSLCDQGYEPYLDGMGRYRIGIENSSQPYKRYSI